MQWDSAALANNANELTAQKMQPYHQHQLSNTKKANITRSARFYTQASP